MRTFELDIFIDCKQAAAYEQLAQPINMIGLQPWLTEIDVLKEKQGADGILLRPFYMVETRHLLRLPVFKRRIYTVIHLTRPGEELEYHVFRNPNIEIVFKYTLRQYNDLRTHITQNMTFVRVPRLLENFVADQAKQAQRALLSNLKVRLEKG